MPEILADYHWNTHQQTASTMQQAPDHFSTSSASAAGSPATANLIQQAQPSAQTAAAATTPTSAGSADGAAGTDNNGHDYKTVRNRLLVRER